LAELSERSGVSLRTIKKLLNTATSRPHARTLHVLAETLEADVDEFFQNAATLAHRHFDRQTNPVVTEIVESQPHLVDGWTEAEFDELYSRFGLGGALTAEGTLETVERMNRNRNLIRKVLVLLETDESQFLCDMIELLYEKVLVTDSSV
jgi:transcriptional regulator with XRE-family HTH domain